MKTIMKSIKWATVSLSAIALVACESDSIDASVIASDIDPMYELKALNSAEIAQIITWNIPAIDFGVNSPVNFALEGSFDSNFETTHFYSGTITPSASQTSASYSMKVGDMLAMAELGGYDNDPETTDGNGNANNTGTAYMRVKAFIGAYAATASVYTTSPSVSMNFVIDESTGASRATWGVVGSAANNWGASPDLPFYTTSSANVFVAYVNLKDGEIKFRENNSWDNNLGDNDADGSLESGGANIAIAEAGDYRIIFNQNTMSYTIDKYSLGVVGSAWNDWGGGGPDAKMFYDNTTDSFVVGVKLLAGELKVRLNSDWGTNYGSDGEGGSNLVVASDGYYEVRVNIVQGGLVTLTEKPLWGIVGGAYNDWGGGGPDATMTEVNPGVWFAENVTFIDGEFKFRLSEDWGTNLGDNDANGSLDDGGANLSITAGTYDVTLDLNTNTYSLIAK
jgi:starch-binding outer membrane protein SusE/F